MKELSKIKPLGSPPDSVARPTSCLYTLQRRAAQKSGSTLVWTMTLVFLLAIMLTIALTITATGASRNASRHIDNQAYYTALSTSRTFAEWIKSGEAKTFLLAIQPGQHKTIQLDEQNGLPSGAGNCTVEISFDAQNANLLNIVSTADYQGSRETVKVQLKRSMAPTSSPAVVSNFQVNKYLATVAAINAMSRDANPILVGDKDEKTDAQDLQYIAAISANDKTREVKYAHDANHGSSDSNANPDIFMSFSAGAANGTYSLPTASVSYQENVRSFVVPANGRITYNPLKSDGSNHGGKTDGDNTRLSLFSISGTAGKNVFVRLGGDSRNGTKYNIITGLDFVDQKTGSDMEYNSHMEYLPNNLSHPVALTKASNGYYEGYIESFSVDLRQPYWYPQLWNSCTIFTQRTTDSTINGGVDARLIFAPFTHGYNWDYIDYWGWGSYVRNPNYGWSKGDAFKAFPSMGETVGRNKRGMPSVPVYYGPNFSMYLLDSTGKTAVNISDPNYKGNMAWLQQGVNVVDGTIYSVRGLTLGGCMNRSQSWYSSEGVNLGSMVDAYLDNDDPTGWFVGYFGQLRYGQILYNTDIVLLTPEGTTSVRNSYIKRPLNYRDVQSQSSSNDAANRNWRKTQSYYKPKEKIIGGQIYIGKNQNLTIEGGRQIISNPNGTYAAPGKTASDDVFTGEYNMLVSPDAITVASGGILVIEASENTNITTDIFVEGDLIIKPGAKISGAIHVYGGGKIDIQGTFSMDSPQGEKGGIFICGSTTESNGALTGSGQVKNLNVNFLNNIAIQGNSGKIHFLDDAFANNWLASGNSAGTWNTATQRNRVLCTARDQVTNQCLHPGLTQGGVFEYIWEIEGYTND